MKHLPEILYTGCWLSFFCMIKLLLSINLSQPGFYVYVETLDSMVLLTKLSITC